MAAFSPRTFSNAYSWMKMFEFPLTHWGRVTHICVSKLTFIRSDNGLSPGRRQAIIWTNAGLLLIGPLGTNFSDILIEILIFSFKKMHLKVSSAKRRPFCLGLNELIFYWSYSWGSNWQYINTGVDNGLPSDRREGIIWTNGGLVYWCIYATMR